MNKKVKIWGLVILALIGLGLSLELCHIYYNVNFLQSNVPSFCVINDKIDCDAVARTSYAEFFGIPLALLGVCLYSFVLFLCFVDKLQKIKFLSILKVFKNPVEYIYSLYCFSFAVSMLLVVVQFFAIEKFCLLCFITYLVDLVSLLYAKNYKESFMYEFKVSVRDFVDAIKVKTNLIALVVVLLFASGAVCYANISHIFTPHLVKQNTEEFDENSPAYFGTITGNPYNVSGNILGNEKGKVVVSEYSDFECPMCKVMNRMLQKAVMEYDNVYVIHYNYPLDMACNPIVTKPFHQNSCLYARFAIAAKEQGKYWEMVNLIFDNHPTSNKKLFKLARKNEIDILQLANDYLSDKVQKELFEEIKSGINKRIDATPTIYINGEKQVGISSYDELTKHLVKHGAVLKNKEK